MTSLDLELIASFVDEGQDLLQRWENSCVQLQKTHDPNVIHELFRVAHNLKGSSRCVGLEAFGNFIHRIEDGIVLIKGGEAPLTASVILALLKAQTILVQWLKDIRQNPGTVPSVDGFLNEFKHVLSTKAETTQNAAVPQTPRDAHSAPPSAAPPILPPLAKATPSPTQINRANPDETIRVSASKIEQLLELIGELSIQQAIVGHHQNDVAALGAHQAHALYLSRKLTKELYERALSLRMNPVQPIFQRLERSVREIAMTLGKEIEVVIRGGDVELDKTVCEKIIEPLTHMARNAVDHGLETPEARETVGKARVGTITISAIQESSSVQIVIEDDGRGLNEEKILKKAREANLWDGQKPLRQEEIFGMIFLPGFSTAEKVTEVSGRGVGMDVVMRTLESLSGTIHISSKLGKGTRFEISLPTSLSIIDALIAQIDGAEYVVPVADIDEIVPIVLRQGESVPQKLKWGESIIPLLPLHSYFASHASRSDAPSIAEEKTFSAMLTRQGQNRVGMVVENIGRPQQLVIKPLQGALASVFGVSGATILSDGKPGLILDLGGIAKAYLSQFQNSNEKERAAS